MPPKLLIVNCASPYFFYIPMGSFGLCDYLRQRGMEARIFNPAQYGLQEAERRLLALLDEHAPSHVGFACHWQETAHGLLDALATVRAWNPAVVTLCGGFTASWFGEDLLASAPALDYVITGDPEEPVRQLLAGEPVETIPNLIHRRDGQVVRNPECWLADRALLDTLSFAGLDGLVDAGQYIETINTKLGFPLFLGRGCVFACEYCGGSRQAFRLHSGRLQPVCRSLAAVLADLRALKPWTDLLYLCYENDPQSIKALFTAIAGDEELKGHFTLHYGAWHLLDPEFLALYRAAFNTHRRPPLFEFSPEVVSDATRMAIKRGTTYSFAGLIDNIGEVCRDLEGRARIEVFFSRYHPAVSAEALMDEIGAVMRLKHRLFREHPGQVRVCFDHLSTDVGSRYWQEQVKEPSRFEALLRLKEAVDEGVLHPFPVDNLCLFVPDHLEPGFVLRIEALLAVLEQLERRCRELFHLLLASQSDRWIWRLFDLLDAWLGSVEARAAFFADPPLTTLLGELGDSLRADATLPMLPFLPDLIRFTRKKLAQAERQPVPAAPASAADHLVLDSERYSIHEQDYAELQSLLLRLDQAGGRPLAYERTVCFFLTGGILSMAHREFRATLAGFEQPQSLDGYEEWIEGKGGDPARYRPLVEQLRVAGVLRPAVD